MLWAILENWQTIKWSNFTKFSYPCLDDHQFKQEELESVGGEISEVCPQNVLKCLYLAPIGRPDILLSVNKLARSVTKWTQACDRRLATLISYIGHTNDFRQDCHVGNTAQHCRLGLFQDSDFAGDLEDSKSNAGGVLCIFGSRTFVPVCWTCKKQTSVSHSSPESKIFSGLLDYVWMEYLLLIFGTWWLKYYFQPTTLSNPTIVASRKLVRLFIPKPRSKMSQEGKSLSNWMMWTMHTFFSRWVSVVHFWGQWSRDKIDN